MAYQRAQNLYGVCSQGLTFASNFIGSSGWPPTGDSHAQSKFSTIKLRSIKNALPRALGLLTTTALSGEAHSRVLESIYSQCFSPSCLIYNSILAHLNPQKQLWFFYHPLVTKPITPRHYILSLQHWPLLSLLPMLILKLLAEPSWCFEWEMSPQARLTPRSPDGVVVWEVLEPLRDKALLEEICH